MNELWARTGEVVVEGVKVFQHCSCVAGLLWKGQRFHWGASRHSGCLCLHLRFLCGGYEYLGFRLLCDNISVGLIRTRYSPNTAWYFQVLSDPSFLVCHVLSSQPMSVLSFIVLTYDGKMRKMIPMVSSIWWMTPFLSKRYPAKDFQIIMLTLHSIALHCTVVF